MYLLLTVLCVLVLNEAKTKAKSLAITHLKLLGFIFKLQDYFLIAVSDECCCVFTTSIGHLDSFLLLHTAQCIAPYLLPESGVW
jgi:hypothetical protein